MTRLDAPPGIAMRSGVGGEYRPQSGCTHTDAVVRYNWQQSFPEKRQNILAAAVAYSPRHLHWIFLDTHHGELQSFARWFAVIVVGWRKRGLPVSVALASQEPRPRYFTL